MKILMVNKFLYPKGGAETYILKIGEYFRKQGHHVEYFGMCDQRNIVSNCCNIFTSNLDFHKLQFKLALYPFKIIYSREAYKKITRLIKILKPDIIHLNNINFQLTPSIIEAAYKLNIPMIQTVHDYQMICPNHLLFQVQTRKTCDDCITGSKWNCSIHRCIHNSFIKSSIGAVEAILYKKRNTYEKVDLYLCPSKFMEQKLLLNQIYHSKTKVIRNFIDNTNFIKENENIPEVIPTKEDYVLYFGRLSSEKGIELFLNACRKLPEILFIIAGSGPLENMCKGVANVRFVGFKTGSELNDLISRALFTVCPSLCHENCSLSILESISLGTPVIATNMGGTPELIDDGNTGILLKEATTLELTKQIEQLYYNCILRSQMKQNCMIEKERMISLESYCMELINLYVTVIHQHIR